MSKRTIEIFSAGCPLCDELVATVREAACPSCEVSVSDLQDPAVAKRARKRGVTRAPAVVVDGKLADCCEGGVSLERLRELGLGRPLAGSV